MALREKDASIVASSSKRLTFGGARHGLDTRWSDARQRSGRSRAAPVVGPGDRHLHPGRPRRQPVAGDHAQRRVADELRLRARESRRRGHAAGGAAPGRVVPHRPRGGDGAGQHHRARRLRRLDHGRRALDHRHQQPLAGRAGPASRGAEESGRGGPERRHQRQPRARRRRRPQRAGPLRQGRAAADRRHARGGDGRHQRHRPGAQQPLAERRGPDCRPQAAHRARPRARPEDLRRHADPVRRRGLFRAGRRGQAAGAQRLDPHAAAPTTG